MLEGTKKKIKVTSSLMAHKKEENSDKSFNDFQSETRATLVGSK